MEEKKLNETIKILRESRGISQRELARRINVNNAVIARIESGETKKPSFQLLKSLSREFKIELYSLLKAANYTDDEINTLGYVDIIGTKYYESQIITKYLCSPNGDDVEVDLVRIFKDYKNDKISLSKTFALISIATGGIDLTKYIPEELMLKYNLKNIDIIDD